MACPYNVTALLINVKDKRQKHALIFEERRVKRQK
jgi:hypothetical protein